MDRAGHQLEGGLPIGVGEPTVGWRECQPDPFSFPFTYAWSLHVAVQRQDYDSHPCEYRSQVHLQVSGLSSSGCFKNDVEDEDNDANKIPIHGTSIEADYESDDLNHESIDHDLSSLSGELFIDIFAHSDLAQDERERED